MNEQASDTTAVNITAVAQSYRYLVLWVGVALVVNLGQIALSGRSPASPEYSALLVGGLVCAVAVAGYSYLTAKALGSRVAWLWAIGMSIPCVGLILILSISSKATRACREQGVPVGFLGPRMNKAATEHEHHRAG